MQQKMCNLPQAWFPYQDSTNSILVPTKLIRRILIKKFSVQGDIIMQVKNMTDTEGIILTREIPREVPLHDTCKIKEVSWHQIMEA